MRWTVLFDTDDDTEVVPWLNERFDLLAFKADRTDIPGMRAVNGE